MRKNLWYLAACFIAVMLSVAAFSQTVTISGNVRNNVSKENVPAVSVTIKGSSQGTFTNDKGDFRIAVNKLPVVLLFSSIGFDNQEITVSSATESLQIEFVPHSSLGEEVVLAATRTPTRILESPVTIERMSPTVLRNLAAPNPYEAITNLKGVDMHTASLTFRTVTTRGFVASGNTRLNQLIDGMETRLRD
ncbi:MAG: carboxypeptidase-like regulatory domain-containing protein [Bacteroidota bacterium]|nr:carboxypeptidase-like regulatory domain-containing protein [Bacteroidota bacterium]